MVSSFGPMEMVGTGFYAPGTYVSVVDTAQSGDSLIFNVDTASSAYDSALPQETRESMKKWLVNQAGVAEGDIDLKRRRGPCDPVAGEVRPRALSGTDYG